MKKSIGWLGWILFGITFVIAVIYIAIPKYTTCDFRGHVEEIQVDEENGCTWITISEVTNADSHIKLKVTKDTTVKDKSGMATSADKITVGVTVDVNIKGGLKEETYYQAKLIKFYGLITN